MKSIKYRLMVLILSFFILLFSFSVIVETVEIQASAKLNSKGITLSE